MKWSSAWKKSKTTWNWVCTLLRSGVSSGAFTVVGRLARLRKADKGRHGVHGCVHREVTPLISHVRASNLNKVFKVERRRSRATPHVVITTRVSRINFVISNVARHKLFQIIPLNN